MCDRNLKIDQTQNFNLSLNLVVLDLVDEPQEVTNVRVFFVCAVRHQQRVFIDISSVAADLVLHEVLLLASITDYDRLLLIWPALKT